MTGVKNYREDLSEWTKRKVNGQTMMDSVLATIMKERGLYRLSGGKANQLTRECLQKALIFLMGEKPFDKISITELVKASGVSRQSFYRNYKSKEDILTDMGQNIRQSIEKFLMDYRYAKDTYQWYFDLFTFMKENEDNIRLLQQAKFYQNTSADYMPALHDIFEADTEEDYYRILAYEGAVNAVVAGWLEGGMKEEIDYMARLCDGFYGDVHRKLLEKQEKRRK